MVQVDRASDRAHELEAAILRTEEERDALSVRPLAAHTLKASACQLLPARTWLASMGADVAHAEAINMGYAQAALEREKQHFEDIISALRAEATTVRLPCGPCQMHACSRFTSLLNGPW